MGLIKVVQLTISFILLIVFFCTAENNYTSLKENINIPQNQPRSFQIDFTHNVFLKDNKPFQYISGSVIYSRIPEIYWYDRLSKVKAAGLNTIQFYVPWNFHEFKEGQYNFQGNANLDKFLSIARELDLLVLLRAGPYMCGEWDFGGLPAWLLHKNPQMVLRSSEQDYLQAVLKWFSVLLPIVKPHLYQNNGSIIMVQIENEYGSYYTCDQNYLKALYNNVRFYLGNDIIIYSTDGNGYSYLVCGSSDRRIFSTVDFGTSAAMNPESAFSALKSWQPKGPLVNSEYYSGWLDSWGYKHNKVAASDVVKGLIALYNYSSSVNVNMYMFHGGTSFGYWSGANDPPFLPQITSYDYDAPISEAGDITSKYMAIRSAIQSFNPNNPLPPVPPNTTKVAYGLVAIKQQQNFLIKLLSGSFFTSLYPVTMESLGQYQGFMVYLTNTSTFLTENVSDNQGMIKFSRIGDIAYVFTSSEDNTEINYQGKLDRTMKDLSLKVDINANLFILLENVAHVNYGRSMFNDIKGVIGNVTLNGSTLSNWKHIAINLANVNLVPDRFSELANSIPTQAGLYMSTFKLDSMPQDTFLKTPNFSKGVVLVNNFNLGRYWNTKGPQYTLFVPKSTLNYGWNNITLFELEGANCKRNCFVEFVKEPILDGPIHFDL